MTTEFRTLHYDPSIAEIESLWRDGWTHVSDRPGDWLFTRELREGPVDEPARVGTMRDVGDTHWHLPSRIDIHVHQRDERVTEALERLAEIRALLGLVIQGEQQIMTRQQEADALVAELGGDVGAIRTATETIAAEMQRLEDNGVDLTGLRAGLADLNGAVGDLADLSGPAGEPAPGDGGGTTPPDDGTGDGGTTPPDTGGGTEPAPDGGGGEPAPDAGGGTDLGGTPSP